MSTSILCVGTELLLGQIQDTNSTFIAQELCDSGIDSFEQRKIGDNFERIKSTMLSMLQSADSIIVTGGLGPTHDDITREVTASLMDVELVLDVDAEINMRDIFAKRDREMPQINLRQAMVPVGASVIANENGTAPGLICPVKVGMKIKHIFLVPGVPHEMKPMVTDNIIPFIRALEDSPHVIINRTLKSWGLPESSLSELLGDIILECEQGDVKIGFLARGINGIYIKISAKVLRDPSVVTGDPSVVTGDPSVIPRDVEGSKNSPVNEIENKIMSIIGDYVYAYDDDSMESIVLDLLAQKKASLALAESFTGGLLSSRLVEIPGASDTLKGSIVAYQIDAKEKVLGIEFDDVYSLDCAEKMASAALEKFDSDFAISTTGVSGPGSQFVDGVEHIQGEVFIGLASKDFVISRRLILGGDRQRVREYGTISALNLLREVLLGKTDIKGATSE